MPSFTKAEKRTQKFTRKHKSPGRANAALCRKRTAVGTAVPDLKSPCEAFVTKQLGANIKQMCGPTE